MSQQQSGQSAEQIKSKDQAIAIVRTQTIRADIEQAASKDDGEEQDNSPGSCVEDLSQIDSQQDDDDGDQFDEEGAEDSDEANEGNRRYHPWGDEGVEGDEELDNQLTEAGRINLFLRLESDGPRVELGGYSKRQYLSLTMLAKAIEGILKEAHNSLLGSETQRKLIYLGDGGTLLDRLLLIRQVAIPKNENRAELFASASDPGTSLFKLNIAFPDGTPISLGLFFTDRRGKKKNTSKEAITLNDVPDIVVLLAVKRIVDEEKNVDQVKSDLDITRLLELELQKYGFEIEPTDKKQIERLREKFVRNGIDWLPSATDRKNRIAVANKKLLIPMS